MDHQIASFVKKTLWLLMLLGSAVLHAQCPPPGSTSSALVSRDIPTLKKARKELKNCRKWPDSLALVEHNLGVRYSYRGMLDSAIFFSRSAVSSWEQSGAARKTEAAGKSNFNLGEFLRQRGEAFAAERHLLHSADIFSELSTDNARARLLRTRATLQQVYTSLGEYGKADEIFRLAEVDARALRDTYNLAAVLHDRAKWHLKQDQLNEANQALQALGDSVAHWRASGSEATGNDLEMWIEPYRQHDLGTVLMSLKEYQDSEAAYQKAIPVFSARDDYDNLSRAYHDLAFQRIDERNFAQAIHFLRAQKREAERSGVPRNLAYYHNNMGEYNLRSGSPESAARHFQSAQTIIVPGFRPESPGDTPATSLLSAGTDLPLLLENLRDQALALDSLIAHGTDLRSEQLQVYQSADQIVDLMRSNHDSRASKLFWRREVLPLYEAAISRCAELNDAEGAFYFFEKSKAVLLHEALVKGDALSSLPDSSRRKELRLSEQIIRLEKEANNEQLETLAELRQQLEKLRKDLSAQYPEYGTLKQLPSLSTPAAFSRNVLEPAGHQYLHFLWGSRRVYVLLVKAGTTTLTDLGEAQQLGVLARRVLAYFSGPTEIENDPVGYAKAANLLYEKILGPLELEQGDALLITPDGPLTYLPFNALLTEATPSDRFGDWPFLMNIHPVSYTHSASIIERERQASSEAFSITAFAPFTDGSSPLPYARLSFSNDELQVVGQQYHTDLYRDHEARADALLTSPKEGIIHLSTHAFSSPDEAAPHIAFHDRLLYLDELYTARIPAELVVLSACQTNVGKLAPGEGVLGLGRGFIQAGAGSVVASLWNVNAKAGGQIMANFYEELGQGTPRGKALHLAQQRFLTSSGTRDRAKNPYYWAGLTYYGPDAPLALQPANGFFHPWMLLLLLLPLLLLFRARTQVQSEE